MLTQDELISALKVSSDKWNKYIKESVLIEKP